MSRHKAISVMVDPDELAEIRAAAEGSGMAVGAYVRQLVMDSITKPPPKVGKGKRS